MLRMAAPSQVACTRYRPGVIRRTHIGGDGDVATRPRCSTIEQIHHHKIARVSARCAINESRAAPGPTQSLEPEVPAGDSVEIRPSHEDASRSVAPGAVRSNRRTAPKSRLTSVVVVLSSRSALLPLSRRPVICGNNRRSVAFDQTEGIGAWSADWTLWRALAPLNA